MNLTEQQLAIKVVYSREPNLEVAQVLIDLIIYPFRTNSFFDVGHTVAFSSESPLIPSSPMTTAVFAQPFYQPDPRKFLSINYLDGSFTHIVWFVPTYAVERKFFKEQGAKAFFDLTLDKEIDLADWQRPSVV